MIVVGISDMKITRDPKEVLVTYSLSSCIGVTMYDPNLKIGGMVHCMIPLSKTDPKKAEKNPFMFTDTGIAGLIQAMINAGCRKRNIIVKVAGGASLLDEKGLFRIGERNYTVTRKMLWKNNMLIKSEDVGGNIPRTLFLHMDDGKVEIKSRGTMSEL